VAQPLYEEFFNSAVLLGDILEGKTVEYRNLLPAPILTEKDLDKYYQFNDRAEKGIEGGAPAAEPTKAPAAAQQKTYKLALIQFLKGHPVHRLMQLGFQEGCDKAGAQCDMLLTDSTSPVDMIPLAEQAMAKGYDGVVLYAVDDSFFPTIAKFKAKGIPVCTPHFTSFDQQASGLSAVVGADVVQYAKAAAEALGAKLDGKGSVAVTVGSFNQTENLVAETFKATMAEKYPNIKVLDPQEEGFDQAQAIAKATAIIQGNPDVAGAFSTTGNGPTTWARAAEDANKKGLAIISMDYTRPNLDLVKEGKVYGLVAQPLYEEFFSCAELLTRVLNGEQVEYRNLLPAPIITEKDLDQYYQFNDRAEASMNK
jgi:ribose transport system substrate-binding protein